MTDQPKPVAPEVDLDELEERCSRDWCRVPCSKDELRALIDETRAHRAAKQAPDRSAKQAPERTHGAGWRDGHRARDEELWAEKATPVGVGAALVATIRSALERAERPAHVRRAEQMTAIDIEALMAKLRTSEPWDYRDVLALLDELSAARAELATKTLGQSEAKLLQLFADWKRGSLSTADFDSMVYELQCQHCAAELGGAP